MNKFAILAVLLSACATDPQTDSTEQDQCVLDPTTGACAGGDPSDTLAHVRAIEHNQYPQYLEADAGCARVNGGWSCYGSIWQGSAHIFVECTSDPDGSHVACTVVVE